MVDVDNSTAYNDSNTYNYNVFNSIKTKLNEDVVDLIVGDLVRETNIFPNQVERAKELIRKRLVVKNTGSFVMKTKLKLFVWTDFCRDYSPGLAFAIASDEADARKQIKEAYGFEPYQWGDLSVRPLTRRFAAAVSGGG